MHYYQFCIGDYRRDTDHLSLVEHAIYRYLIDWYYLDEKPIPKDNPTVIRRLRLSGIIETDALDAVLKDFFKLEEDGWHHERIDMDLASYHHKQQVNSTNGKLGGRPKKTQSVILGYDSETESKANQKATSNHKPLTKNQEPSKNIATKVAPPTGVDDLVWADFLTLRRSKKLPITATAMKGIEREAQKARLTIEQVIRICCERGWGSFKADWIKDKKPQLTGQQSAWLTITGQTANFEEQNHGRTIEADPLPPALLG